MILANRQVGGCVFDDIQKLRTMEAHTIRTKETPSEVGTMMAIFSLPVINWLIILEELAAEEKPIRKCESAGSKPANQCAKIGWKS